MENNTAVTNTENSTKRYFTKTAIVGFIALLLLIPLVMISELIYSRENTKDEVTYEVGRTYALAQTIDYPEIESEVMESFALRRAVPSSQVDNGFYQLDLKKIQLT